MRIINQSINQCFYFRHQGWFIKVGVTYTVLTKFGLYISISY